MGLEILKECVCEGGRAREGEGGRGGATEQVKMNTIWVHEREEAGGEGEEGPNANKSTSSASV